jgi:Ulp1 family protease
LIILSAIFTFFKKYSVKSVGEWVSNVPNNDIFDQKKIIVPLKYGKNHWMCLCVDRRRKTILYLDSNARGGGNALQKFGERKMNEVYNKLEKHWKEKRLCIFGMPLGEAEEWGFWPPDDQSDSAIPQQLDISNSGIFACAYAESLSTSDDFINFTTDRRNQ